MVCGVLARHEGRVSAGGVRKDVAIVGVSKPTVNERIDMAGSVPL